MKSRGHPIRGAIAGFFFGLFLSLDLLIFGIVALDANILALLPILGLLAGTALGLTAPLKRRPSVTAVAAATDAAASDAVTESDAAAEAVPAMASPDPAAQQ